MDDSPVVPSANIRITLLAAAAAGLLAVMTAILARFGDSMMPMALAVAGTAASFAIILAMSLMARDRGLIGGSAIGLAASTRLVIICVVLLGTVAPIMMLLMRDPFLIVPTAIVVNGAAAVGGAGVLLLGTFFVLQFSLAAAGRSVAGESSDRANSGQLLGWFLGLAPVLIAIALGSASEHSRVQAAVKHSHDENAAFLAEYTADSLHQVRRAETEPRRVLTQLHACIHRGCVDSLMLAAKRDSVIVRYNRLPGHRYWASAQAGRRPYARRLVTDQTGTLFDWPVLSPRDDHAAPDSTDILRIADTTVREMSNLGDCVWYQYQLYMEPVPRHVTQVCALSGDTSTMRVANGTDYVIEFLYIKPTRSSPRGDFALSARPAAYGRTEVRSFLIRNEGRDVRVTTDDRAARATDWLVHKFESTSGTARIETH